MPKSKPTVAEALVLWTEWVEGYKDEIAEINKKFPGTLIAMQKDLVRNVIAAQLDFSNIYGVIPPFESAFESVDYSVSRGNPLILNSQ